MKHRAFTLIETLIAVTLTVTVLTAVCELILMTLFANQWNAHAIQALSFAEEGLEAARFMRDSNWRQNYSWDSGTLWGGDMHMDASNSEKTYYLEFTGCSFTAPCYQFSTNADQGTAQTKEGFIFTRSLTYKYKEDGVSEVVSKVEWEEHGIPRNLVLSTYLTAWH